MMKIKILLLLVCSTLLLPGCFETTENLTINEDGSGTYKLDMDFKGLFDLFDTMKAMDTSNAVDNGFPKERKDTTIKLRDFTDTAAALTAAQKALYRNVTMNMLMDGTAKEFKVGVNMPFEKVSDVEKLVKLMGSDEGNGMLGKLFKQNKVMGDEESGGGPGKMPDMNSYYNMTVTKNLIERKLDKAKYDSLMQQYAGQMQGDQMGDMLSGITMNTVIHLPRAAKKVTAANATTSADKKTVTIKGTLADLFKTPQAFSYRIEY